MNLLEVINGNNEWIKRLKTDENLSDLVDWLTRVNDCIDNYDDTVRKTKSMIDSLTKLP